MKKWVAILLMLVLALSLTGCQQDPEKEAAKVVAEVNGEAITKGEAQVVYNQMMMEMQYYYNMYGYSFDATDKSVIASVKSETLTLMSENLALEQKANELGLGLTEEETASVDEDAQNQYEFIYNGKEFPVQAGWLQDKKHTAGRMCLMARQKREYPAPRMDANDRFIYPVPSENGHFALPEGEWDVYLLSNDGFRLFSFKKDL